MFRLIAASVCKSQSLDVDLKLAGTFQIKEQIFVYQKQFIKDFKFVVQERQSQVSKGIDLVGVDSESESGFGSELVESDDTGSDDSY